MTLKTEKGSVSILVMLLMIVILASVGAALDVGMVIIDRTKMSNALDYAALAGAQELPENPSTAIEVANSYLNENGVNPEDVIITIGQNNKSIQITGARTVPYHFLRTLGLVDTEVSANSKVILGATVSVKGGLRPFAVEDFPYTYGALITLKNGGGDGYLGNYGVVALGGSGASIYEYNALYGYAGEVRVGDEIDTEPGNMASVSNQLKTYINGIPHTFEDFPRDSDRLWTVPVVNTLEDNGRGTVLVVGFAQVFVEDIIKRSGKIEIDARFIKFVVNGDIDVTAIDYGTYGVKLVN